jgi:hypothetical protein
VRSGLDFSAMLADLEAAFAQVATSALGLGDVITAERWEESNPQLQGAYLGLVASQMGIQIGIASDAAGCQVLSKGLLGRGDDAAPLDAPEMADAFCEIANIVAGTFKSRVRDRLGTLAMGLPFFFQGAVTPTQHTSVKVALVRAGQVRAALTLVHPRT